MKPRRLLDPFSSARRRPTWSYHHTGTLDRLISFACHSYENTRGHCFHRALRASRSVGVFFPFWNSIALPTPASSNKPASPFVGFLFTDSCRLSAVNYSRLLLSKLKSPVNHTESTLLKVFFLKNLKPFEINTFEKTGRGVPITVNHLLETSHPLFYPECSEGLPAQSLRAFGAGELMYGTSRIEIRKLPFFRPTTSNFAEFSAPPLLEARAGFPPTSSAISGARLRASSSIFDVVPRTRTVSARCSSGFSGEESACSSSPTRVSENGGDCRFAQETSTAALPGCKSGGGSTTNAVGEDASTSAGCPASVTRLESASPQKPFPSTSKRSASEAARGVAEISSEAVAASADVRTTVATRPVRPAIEPKITPGFSGATNTARPVVSVVSRSPFEKFTVTRGVSRPFKSSTASVARSPDTIRRGSSSCRAPEAAGAATGCWQRASGAKTPAIRKNQGSAKRRKNMRGIVVENRMPMKATYTSRAASGRLFFCKDRSFLRRVHQHGSPHHPGG